MQAGFSESGIMSSCVMPRIRGDANPVVLLNCFDRMEICISFAGRCRLKVWAIDVLGWGFSDLEGCNSKCETWFRSYKTCNLSLFGFYFNRRTPAMECSIKQIPPLPALEISHQKTNGVGPSLGAAVAKDFAFNFSEVVKELIS
ncbi:alpha/beta-Hydrolases superfamily protein [Salvia divinorum]|uniref:Alpha/beta-Hydrolases superfamily protein n=1 Tax=Salvia divinorum TaxID=28513 RepID=A0ABD1HSK6_SALDI